MGNFEAFILNTGELISIAKDDSKEVVPSNGLVDERFMQKYESGEVVRPPYEADNLVALLDINTYHMRCCRQKAVDIAGLGFDVEPLEQDVDKKQILEPKRRELLNFFKNCNKRETFSEVVIKAWTDWEAVGWLAIEVTRNKMGQPAGMYHIPAHTVRYKSDGTGLIQRRQTKNGFAERHFKWFGDTNKLVDPNTNKPMTEVIYIVNYSPKSDYYGVPDFIPSVGAMVGNNHARDYNINFFGNNAVPQYAVILEGGELTADVEQKIKEHFRNNLKGNSNAHRTLVLTAPDGGKIEFKPLAVEVKEGHFRLYRKDNRDEVVHAHGVPPYRIGIVEAGTLAGNIAPESTKIYKYSIVQPRQERLQARIQMILTVGFGIKDFEFKFNEIDTDDEKLKADIGYVIAETAKIWLDAGVIKPNEARKDYLKKESFPDEDKWGNEVLPIVRLASNPAWLQANAGQISSGATTPADMIANTPTPDPAQFDQVKAGMGGTAVKKSLAEITTGLKHLLDSKLPSPQD